MARQSLASSPGWKVKLPTLIHSCAPNWEWPMTGSIGNSSSTMPVNIAT